MAVYILGQLFKGIDENDQPVYYSGFHVNSDSEIPELDSYRVNPDVPTAENPDAKAECLIAGVPTYFYKFANEAEAQLMLGDLWPQEVPNETVLI